MQQGLRDPDNYHEFCRLLARLKSNYQLGELIAVPCYPEALALIAKFTVESLQVYYNEFLFKIVHNTAVFHTYKNRCGSLLQIVCTIC